MSSGKTRSMIDGFRVFFKRNFGSIILVITGACFLGIALEVYLSHVINNFAVKSEYWPLWYSVVAGPLLILVGLGGDHMDPHFRRLFSELLLWPGVLLGILGFYFHGERFMADPDLGNLVYAAPILAPFAYTGIALFAIACIEITQSDRALPYHQRGRILMFLVAIGFAFNAAVAALDHARNGFFVWEEWLAVIFSMIAAAWFFLMSFHKTWTFFDRDISISVIIMQFLVGGLGMLYHVLAVGSFHPLELETFIYAAPILAPGVMAVVGLFALLALFDPANEFSDDPAIPASPKDPQAS